MTTTGARPEQWVLSGTSDPVRSPDARRLRPPRWRDRRMALGVVIVLVAVLVGARVLATGARTAAVLVATRPMAAGHVLSPEDLRTDHVRLGSAVGAYWPAADLSGLTGHPLLTAVGSGDLLPRSAVGQSASPQPTRVVSLPVEPSRLPPLAAGDLVDVFATAKATGSTAGSTVAILRGVAYVGGGDTDNAGTVTVRLQVPVADAGALVRASETTAIDLVLQQPAGDDAGDVGGAPVSGAAPSP